MTSFWLIFIPLFVAIDPIGNVSIFMGLTQGHDRKEKCRLALHAVITAFIVGLVFGFGGTLIFQLVGITPSDFQIAGGLLLLILSVKEIFGDTVKETEGKIRDRWAGIVPLGIPLTAGPALITTLLILHENHSHGLIVIALAVNLLIAFGMFLCADTITERMGEAFSKGTAKVVAIFLAAIAVMMIRRGLETLLLR